MNIQIIITDDNNKHVLTESVDNFSDARIILEGTEYEYDARQDNLTDGE